MHCRARADSPSSESGSNSTLVPDSSRKLMFTWSPEPPRSQVRPADEGGAVASLRGDLVGEHAEQERVVGRAHGRRV